MYFIAGYIYFCILVIRAVSSGPVNRYWGGNGEGSLHKLWRLGLWRLAVVPLLLLAAYTLTGRKRPGKPDYARIAALEAECFPPLPEPTPVRRVPVLTPHLAGDQEAYEREAARQRARGPARSLPFTPRVRDGGRVW